jgi:hypothetical protein
MACCEQSLGFSDRVGLVAIDRTEAPFLSKSKKNEIESEVKRSCPMSLATVLWPLMKPSRSHLHADLSNPALSELEASCRKSDRILSG